MSSGLPSRRRRRHRPGGHADAAPAARARVPRARDRAVRLRALRRARARRRRGDGATSPCRRSARRPSRASTSRSSPPAAPPRASGRRASSTRAPWWSTTPRAGACTTTCRSSSREVNPDALAEPPRHHRQPQLLHDADGRRAQAAPRRRRDRAARDLTYQAVSGTGKARRGRAARPVPRAAARARDRPPQRLRPPDRLQRAPPRRLVRARRRPHRRGAQADRRDAQDPRRLLDPRQRHLRARAGLNGHSEAVNVQTREPSSPPSARASCSPRRPA